MHAWQLWIISKSDLTRRLRNKLCNQFECTLASEEAGNLTKGMRHEHAGQYFWHSEVQTEPNLQPKPMANLTFIPSAVGPTCIPALKPPNLPARPYRPRAMPGAA